MGRLEPCADDEAAPGLRGNVWLISVTAAVLITALYTWNRLLPFMLRERGADDLQVSLIYTLMNLTVNLFQYPGGVMADRQGRKLWVVMPTLGVGMLYLAVFFTPGWAAFAALLVAVNCLNAVQAPAFVALMAESVPAAERGRAFAVLQFFVGASVAAGPALGALLLPLVGADALVVVTGAIFIGCGLVRQFRLRETLREAPAPQAADLGRPGFRRLWALLAVSTAFVALQGLTAWGPFIALYLADSMGYTPRQVNLLFALAPLLAVGFSPFGGRITDRLGAGRVLGLACLAHVVTLAGWLFTRGLGLTAFFLVLVFGSIQLAGIAFDTLRAEVAGDRERGRVLGVLGTAAGTAAAMAPVLAGLLSRRFGPLAPFGLAAMAALSVPGAVRLLRPAAGAGERAAGREGRAAAGAG
ncbi:MAG: MFS transporter [Acetobacteraceae bacterium]|nr:MFS transporter [Acetobacteraceae bacterium]